MFMQRLNILQKLARSYKITISTTRFYCTPCTRTCYTENVFIKTCDNSVVMWLICSSIAFMNWLSLFTKTKAKHFNYSQFTEITSSKISLRDRNMTRYHKLVNIPSVVCGIVADFFVFFAFLFWMILTLSLWPVNIEQQQQHRRPLLSWRQENK